MDLKQQLVDYGCGTEFIDIAMGYAQFYQPQQDIETFIDYVEEAHAKVEEAQYAENMENEIVNPSDLSEAFQEFEDEESL